METSKLSTGVWVALLIGLVVGFLIGWGVYGRQGSGAPIEDTAGLLGEVGTSSLGTNLIDLSGKESNPAAETTVMTSANFKVSDQMADDNVTVRDVKAEATSWLAVRDYQNGKLGNILGARRLEAGTQEAVSVLLLRATAAGKNYAVVLYRDNGDKLFDHKLDTLVESEGKPLIATFSAR